MRYPGRRMPFSTRGWRRGARGKSCAAAWPPPKAWFSLWSPKARTDMDRMDGRPLCIYGQDIVLEFTRYHCEHGIRIGRAGTGPGTTISGYTGGVAFHQVRDSEIIGESKFSIFSFHSTARQFRGLGRRCRHGYTPSVRFTGRTRSRFMVDTG